MQFLTEDEIQAAYQIAVANYANHKQPTNTLIVERCHQFNTFLVRQIELAVRQKAAQQCLAKNANGNFAYDTREECAAGILNTNDF